MGTRSLTAPFECWQDENGKLQKDEICVMYRQFDGYVSGHGKELVDFFQNKYLCNGIGVGQDVSGYFNGMDCLAASLIAHFKEDIGGVYLYRAETRKTGEEYIYKITTSDNKTLDIECCEVSGFDADYREHPGHFILKKSKPTSWFVKECNKG